MLLVCYAVCSSVTQVSVAGMLCMCSSETQVSVAGMLCSVF